MSSCDRECYGDVNCWIMRRAVELQYHYGYS